MMNKATLVAFLLVASLLPRLCAAQDGWLFSAQPPIIVRFDREALVFRFTNTSDRPIHGVTLHTEKDGQKQSRVIIDTIEPHGTASVTDASVTVAAAARDATITCNNYSKPLKVLLHGL